MKATRKWLIDVARSVFFLVVVISMSACGHTMSWREEVPLHDGQIMVVKHFSNLGGYPTLYSHNRSSLDETLTFSIPGSDKKITWKTEYRKDNELNSLSPLLLDVVDGVPYLATGPAGCIPYNKWGRPNPPYILFKYVNNDWVRIPLEEFPSVLTSSNLMSWPDSRSYKSYYTVDQVKKHLRERGVSEDARTILREPVEGIEGSIAGCEELVYYKGVWVGPGDSIGKRMMDMKSK